MPLGVFALSLILAGNRGGSPWGLLVLLPVIAWYVVSLFRSPAQDGEVAVGADGLLIARGGRERFISFANVTDVHIHRGRDGIVCTVDGRRRSTTLVTDDSALHGATLEAWQSYCDASDRSDELERVERRIADVEEFSKLAASDYRAAAVDPAELSAVVGDESAPLALRAAAAVGLEGRGEDGLARLRIAADGLVAPGHREALLRIADAVADERQVLIEALAEEEASVLDAKR